MIDANVERFVVCKLRSFPDGHQWFWLVDTSTDKILGRCLDSPTAYVIIAALNEAQEKGQLA